MLLNVPLTNSAPLDLASSTSSFCLRPSILTVSSSVISYSSAANMPDVSISKTFPRLKERTVPNILNPLVLFPSKLN